MRTGERREGGERESGGGGAALVFFLPWRRPLFFPASLFSHTIHRRRSSLTLSSPSQNTPSHPPHQQQVDLPAGDGGPGGATAATSSARPPLLEYKYVVLEEQDWTALRDDASEGLVPPAVTYRTTAAGGGPASRPPPDSKSIARKMAIVAWQPGPNRALAMPTTAELAALVPGVAVERAPARPTSGGAGTGPGGLGEWQQQGGGGAPPQPPPPPAWDPSSASARDPYEGTWEVLSLKPDPEAGGQLRPRLDRHDVWGYFPSKAGGGGPPTQPPPGDGGAGAGGGGAGGGSNGQQGSQRPPGLPRFGI